MSATQPIEHATDITLDDIENIQLFIHTVLRPAAMGPTGTDVQRTALALLKVANEEAALAEEAHGEPYTVARLESLMAHWNRLLHTASSWEDRAGFERDRWQTCIGTHADA